MEEQIRIILTHEQADFDAIASMLAAYLLERATIPVLPRRMNRNARAFLTIYGSELPFVEASELGSLPISNVTLVDTQSMVTLRGMNPTTQVHVIDHHPLRGNLPQEWEVWVEEIGATTTLLTEILEEHEISLTPIQATLLLLGIYEDTGSLTYTRSSYRDLHAAGYLLEQGGSLHILNDFLNHPLSPDQQKIYEQLRANIEIHRINGHNVMLSLGDARSMDEELSTIAHKLRDLFDSDALFVIVQTRSGIQLIARSTTDDIDVGQILGAFGGGGHERAAASLIRDRDIQEIRSALLEILPASVKPAITVAQIMSGRPQLLVPETPVDEAARRMSLYGYEGYPVVSDGRVIGLLTRRAVDRALAHRLTHTAEQLMDAGEISVQPDDPLEVLQEKMISSGWGQVPVVDPTSGQVIGIVTRTDLLKMLPRQALPRHRQNYAARLETALPSARLLLLKAVIRAASQQGVALFVVGGFVRDLLLERAGQDFDLVVEGDAVSLAKRLAKIYGGRVTSHARFGTAKWHIGEIRQELIRHMAQNGSDQDLLKAGRFFESESGLPEYNPSELPESLDLVSARIEFYSQPTALPTVERGSIKLDLHRRDFTINTLAIRLDGDHYGELYDYWGGLEDLHHCLVRVLHSLSFVDDPTRMLRAVRFEKRFDFQIEQRTLDLLQDALPLLVRVSGDRIRHELNLILDESKIRRMLPRLQELQVLKAIDPMLCWNAQHAQSLDALLDQSYDPDWDFPDPGKNTSTRRTLIYAIWLCSVSEPEVKRIADRIKLPAYLRRLILQANQLLRQINGLEQAPVSGATSVLDEYPPLVLYAVRMMLNDPPKVSMINNYIKYWRKIHPFTNGDKLRNIGLPPGPEYQEILWKLRAAWLDKTISTEAEENRMLEELLAS